ncbi:MAG: F0F1 ATP synthase subunit A [Candidatus Levyibacteriota bacterium]|nr:MAG: F0F1 ATP synthase subunit A [Candidatus Levybacteria bacterium]
MSSFAPEVITHIGSFPITNTILNTLLIDSFLIGTTYAVTKKITMLPSKLQNAGEMLLETFYDMTASIAGERTKQIFPYFMTFFLFILVANWSGLLPGVSSIGFFEESHGKKELIPLIRGATSDVNTTFALAIISLVATHVMSIKTLGLKGYFSHFFTFSPIYFAPIFVFVGLLEVVSEFTKMISLSFRLFGNIYAGEVVLATVSNIFSFLFPLPFMLLEVIVGFVQALVFSMLTFVFMTIFTTPHHAEEHAREVNN